MIHHDIEAILKLTDILLWSNEISWFHQSLIKTNEKILQPLNFLNFPL